MDATTERKLAIERGREQARITNAVGRKPLVGVITMTNSSCRIAYRRPKFRAAE